MKRSSYKRVKNDNLWNEQPRLSKKFSQYHTLDHTFRKTSKNLEQIESQLAEDIKQAKAKKILNNMKESKERTEARKLEHKIKAFKSAQSLSNLEKEEIAALDAYDPNLVEELLLKSKW